MYLNNQLVDLSFKCWRLSKDVVLLWRVLTCMLAWECHERYLQRLFQHFRDEVPDGFTKLTAQQVLRADRQVFLHMIQKVVRVRRTPANTLEMDTDILDALSSHEDFM